MHKVQYHILDVRWLEIPPAQSGYHLGIFTVHGDDWESYKHMRDGMTYKFPNMSCSPRGNGKQQAVGIFVRGCSATVNNRKMRFCEIGPQPSITRC